MALYVLLHLILSLPVPAIRAIEHLSWPQVVAAVTCPIMVGKQIINVVQFCKAAKMLTESDQEDRYAAQHAKAR